MLNSGDSPFFSGKETMEQIPDAPWIRKAERDGYPDEPLPHCPECGEETDTFYVNAAGDVVGCNNCVKVKDAWDYQDSI